MNSQKPYEQIRFINDVIKDRKDKNQSTFFSVKLDIGGKETPLVDKETGDTFYETIIQYLTRYDIHAILIELYHGKAHNIKEPLQSFRIPLRRSSDMSLGIIQKEDIPLTPAESVVTAERHFSGIMEKERQILFLDFEVRKLQNEVEELKKKNKKRKQYIEQLESEIGKTEKAKKHSLGNVSLGLVASNALESFAKSNFGIGILKNVFGAKEEVLNGLLGLDEQKEQTEKNREPEQKASATLITKTKEPEPQTEEEKIRRAVLKQLNEFLNSLDNGTLRLYFEVVKLIGTDQPKLQQVYTALKFNAPEAKADIKEAVVKPLNTTEPSNGNEEEENDDPDHEDSS
ncbi:MAG: hypothetical protein Q8M29_04900 [Bacteroidota bacterium]|nr:hypothetical protein [Bacteroidota bacterium]